jgi:hypothetical protein
MAGHASFRYVYYAPLVEFEVATEEDVTADRLQREEILRDIQGSNFEICHAFCKRKGCA